VKTAHRLALLVGIAALGLLTLAVFGFMGQAAEHHSRVEQVTIGHTLRNHMQADMMHDALRADVLSALLAARESRPDAIADAKASFAEHAGLFRDAIEANGQLDLDATVRERLAEVIPALTAYIASGEAVITLAAANDEEAAGARATFLEAFETLEAPMSDISDAIQARAAALSAEADHASSVVLWREIIAAIACLGLLGWVGTTVSRRLLGQLGGEPDAVVDIVQAFADGRFDVAIDADAKASGSIMASLARMQRDLGARIQTEREVASENQRIRAALDAVDAEVMIADADQRIVYINPALHRMFSDAETDLKLALPNFDASTLVGAHINAFHARPERQDRMLRDLTGTHRAEIRIGSRTMRININPIGAADGERVGYIVQWTDRTQEVAIESEVASIVLAATNGELDGRIDLNGKAGFIRQLSDQINQLLAGTSMAMSEISRLLQALAEGDLTRRIRADLNGVYARMRDDANSTADRLASIVAQIQQSSAAINVSAREIEAGNSDLSERTERQAAGLEESASSMEELTSTVRENAERAREANDLSKGAAGVAASGGAIVGDVVSTMRDIQSASQQIADIISVIDGIAFQTNILALNAAVEAARAGEQGRGFAVVASEVRSLAQRSATASREIKTLIESSVDRVTRGSALVDRAGQTMAEVVGSVERVTALMNDIAAATIEQAQGIEQVSGSITQIDESTQQNAALVEEASASARSLTEQATQLDTLVSLFRLGNTRLEKAA